MSALLPLARRPLRRAVHDVRHVAPVPFGRSQGTVRRVYREVERDFGMLAPPVALHSVAPTVLVAVWELLRATLLQDGRTTRAQREAVAAAVSRDNACSYCVEVHEAGAGVDAPDDALDDALDDAFDEAAVDDPELVGVRSAFEYLNRMVTVFLPPSPLPVAAPRPARRLAGRLFAAAARRGVEPSPVTRSAAALLADVSDAADALLGADLAREVRDAVHAALARPPGLLDELPADPSVRLAVLVAVSPERVTADRVRAVGGSDAVVVALAAAGAARAAAAATAVVVGDRRAAG